MHLKTKKIIAKEVILLFTATILASCIIAVINYNLQKKDNERSDILAKRQEKYEQLEQLLTVDPLDILPLPKGAHKKRKSNHLYEVYSKYQRRILHPKFENFVSVLHHYPNVKSIYGRLKNETEFKDLSEEEFILYLVGDNKIYREIDLLNKKLDQMEYISSEDYAANIKTVSFIVFLIFYPIRLITMLLLWCVRVLRQKETAI
jgi:hypothetical protein